MASPARIGSAVYRLGAPPSRLATGGKPVDPFYRSKEWVALAAAIKRDRGYRCEECGADHRQSVWKLRADHIIARKDGGADLDPMNIRCLCPTCDNRKRAAEHVERGRGV